jgi:hypothetical protein
VNTSWRLKEFEGEEEDGDIRMVVAGSICNVSQVTKEKKAKSIFG